MTLIAPTWGPECVASGKGISQTYTDDEASFIITAKDRYGNLRQVGGDSFESKLKDNASGVEAGTTITDLGNGNYNVSYILSASGEYFLHVTLSNLDISGSPFLVQCKWGINFLRKRKNLTFFQLDCQRTLY